MTSAVLATRTNRKYTSLSVESIKIQHNRNVMNQKPNHFSRDTLLSTAWGKDGVVQPPRGADSERILIVDDEGDIRDLLMDGIWRKGLDCRSANNGSDALQLLATEGFGIVLTDINMPGMNGLELARRVRAQFDADVIIITGYVGEFAYEDMIAIGASDFIQKPVTLSELVARLRRVLAERRTRQERNRALEELRTNLDKFRRAMDGVVYAMSQTVEMRDPYTAGHQRRVARLAVAIAKKLGLAPDTIEGLHMVSVIHDLGKIAVPTEILCKPGPLSAIEYEIIKTHPRAGYEILKSIEFPWPVAEVVHQHHERLDGSGYPQGLSGAQILLETRILSVADVYETMATHRPYRPALGREHALKELAAHRGALYDSTVVDVCVQLVQQDEFRFSWDRE